MHFNKVNKTGKMKLRLVFVLIFIVGIVYGVLVGKYQFPPYKVISNIKTLIKSNFDISAIEHLESISPKGEKEKNVIKEKELAVENDARIIAPTLNKILPVIYESKKITPSFDIVLPQLVGYSINFSVVQGEKLSFYIHAKNEAKTEIYWLGRQKEYIKSVGVVKSHLQSTSYSPQKGFNWEPSLTIDTTGFKPGYYVLELTSKISEIKTKYYQIPFIVKSGKAERIAFVAGTNTWNAYNDYAGLSFYDDRQTPDDFKIFNDTLNKLLEFNNASQLPVHLPFARPFSGPFAGKLNAHAPAIKDDRPESPHHSHLMRSEWTLLAFAEENNLVYSIFTDRDVASKSKLFDAEVIVFNSHSEYWSKSMILALQQYIDKGGKVVFAGGNNIYKQVKYNQYGFELIADFKSKDISPIIGTFFSKEVSPMYASYKVVDDQHWIFKGTNIKKSNEFGQYSINHRPEEKSNGASGWEADQYNIYSKEFKVLASGTNEFGAADMVFKDTNKGGWIFNASSIPFTGALFNDKVVAKIMLNLLEDNESKH